MTRLLKDALIRLVIPLDSEFFLVGARLMSPERGSDDCPVTPASLTSGEMDMYLHVALLVHTNNMHVDTGIVASSNRRHRKAAIVRDV
jgi:hypothetical protein